MKHQLKKQPNRAAVMAMLFLLFGVATGMAQESKPGIQFFSGPWKDAVAKAKMEHKCISLDAYASWCGPCKTMDREVFVNPAVASYFNDKFVAIRIDMEKGEGPELAKRFTSIDGYPSLLFFDNEAHLAKTILGSGSRTNSCRKQSWWPNSNCQAQGAAFCPEVLRAHPSGCCKRA